MPVSSVNQYNNTQLQAYENSRPDKASTFSDTLQKYAANINNKTASTIVLASADELKYGEGPNSVFGHLSTQTPTISRDTPISHDFENKYLHISNSIPVETETVSTTKEGDTLSISQETKELITDNQTVTKKESRVERVQNYLKGMLKSDTATIPLGTLSKTNPTVSHVVRNNENIQGFHWDIIHAKINSDKPYSTVSQGTSVSVDPNTLELIFKAPQIHNEKTVSIIEKSDGPLSPQKSSRTDELKVRLQELAQNKNEPFVLGVLSKDMPTVSQVVRNNEHTQNLYKDIVYSDTNRSKPYHNLQPGTKICINPITLELIFEEPLTDKVRKGAPVEACPDKPCTGLSKSERLHQYVTRLEPDMNNLIKIGTLNKDQPTISQVLNNDPRFAGYHWGIILSDINSDKPFSSLPPGTEVSINPENLELLFNVSTSAEKSIPTSTSQENKTPSQPSTIEPIKVETPVLKETSAFQSPPAPATEKTQPSPNPEPLPVITALESVIAALQKETSKTTPLAGTQQPVDNQQTRSLHQYVASLEQDKNNLIKIGTLTKDQPTISQVLKNDPRFAGHHWDIIFSQINRDKPFNSLSQGTDVSINPENLELLFTASASAEKSIPASLSQELATPPQPSTTESIKAENHFLNETNTFPSQSAEPGIPSPQTERYHKAVFFNDTLASSAQEMIGKPSTEVDNYELLLTGLQSQGIECEGKEGLKENLSQLANLMWLDESALQSVDGIVKIAGETVYEKSIEKVATKEQLTNFTDKMAYYLEKGHIITMSTPTFNQSGIVSNRQGEWTLINSNTMDNEKSSPAGDATKISEVAIDQRIASLYTKAAGNNENLTVTVSRLEEKILRDVDMLVEIKREKMSILSEFPKPTIEP